MATRISTTLVDLFSRRGPTPIHLRQAGIAVLAGAAKIQETF